MSTQTLTPAQPGGEGTRESTLAYIRFNLLQRIEHIVLVGSFTTLAVTGLPQKFPLNGTSQAVIAALGGIELTRQIHHMAAILMILQSVYHVVIVGYRVLVQRTSLTMLPGIQDGQHIIQAVLYYIGKRKHMPRFGRYTFAEKMEYWAMVWGTVMMALTGFMMWNPIAATRVLPGEFIPAAKAAHGAEAVLAALAIILWHFYNVHLKQFNTSMFTGRMSEHEMREEHPAELASMLAGQPTKTVDRKTLWKRERIFIPAAGVLVFVLLAGVYSFITLETTAVTTIPINPDRAVAFVPATPTPTPIPAATPTPAAPVAGAQTYTKSILPILQLKCGVCHGQSGGLTLTSYESVMQGGKTGPAVVPGDPDNSLIVKKIEGGHPGQLSPEEMALVIEWIKAGAPK